MSSFRTGFGAAAGVIMAIVAFLVIVAVVVALLVGGLLGFSGYSLVKGYEASHAHAKAAKVTKATMPATLVPQADIPGAINLTGCYGPGHLLSASDCQALAAQLANDGCPTGTSGNIFTTCSTTATTTIHQGGPPPGYSGPMCFGYDLTCAQVEARECTTGTWVPSDGTITQWIDGNPCKDVP